MKKDRSLKQRILAAVMAIVMLTSSLIGTTFAWFTDSVTSDNNVIQTGNLDAQMHWSDELLDYDSDEWNDAEDGTPVFNYNNWEPGYTEVKYVKVSNAGSLNFKWKLSIEANGAVSILGDVIDVYYVNPVSTELESLDGLTSVGKLADVLASKTATSGELTPGGNQILAIAFHMDELAGNEYQNTALCDGGFSLKLLATQATGEFDSFGDDYDAGAQWPEGVVLGNTASAGVTADANNKLTEGASMTSADGKISASVPAGALLAPGTNSLTLNVANMDKSGANITLADNEDTISIDVHILGIAEDNETVMAISVKELLPVGLNMGNYRFYHVEDGQTVEMTLLADGATPVHNNYEYDPATGDVVLHLASFSEVALVAEPAKWKGNFDYDWYTETIKENAEAKDFVIANADQLAAFGAIVGGMVKDNEGNKLQDSFSGKTVKLLADINLGDKESENNPDIIFYPIGYYNSEGTYERTNTAITSGLRIFEGTFDGNGHTVENFYHNTWEMKGDNNYYDATLQYYRDGMGLFGRVYGGTIKNLTVKNFSSDGEYTTTGAIAAYADGATFENIAIFNCNPRVYNIGNGGIVGCVGWYAKEEGLKTTFRNITVDNSNKISALWGSYDVACGGIVGQYYPTSGQTSAGTPKNAGIDFVNCHVSAIMDVYNDVCANYQYYAYRYTGMLIGSVRENVTIDGHSYPKMDGITAKDCTVHFGTWNDYYYCEIIDNTTASYTHDYQMSRLTEIKAIDGTTITYLDGTTGTVPASGRANYVIVDYTKGHGTENATCYHFKDGAVWTHDMGGIQTGIDENGDGKDDLKEDKQHIYLEFNNLVTGYGWGVTSRGFHNLDGVTNLDIDEGNQESSVDKFEAVGNINTYRPGQPIRVGDLFAAKDGVTISGTSVLVSVSAVVDGEVVSATFALDAQDWRNSIITFSSDSVANAKVTITDYIFCNPTEIVLTKENEAPKFNANTVGDKDAYTQVTLGDLFNAIGGTNIGDVIATVTSPDGVTTINATNSDWATKVINLNKSGSWTISIKDNDEYCTETAVTFNVNNIEKFSANTVGAQNAYTQITLGDLFNAIVDDSKIGTVTATVVAPNNVTTTITGTSADWATKSITLVKDGEWTVIITDNASCIETGVTFTVNKVNKFAKTFTNTNFTYRIGNVNEVAFSSLFTDVSPAISAVNRKVVFTNVNGTASATIDDDIIQFSGNGKITVTVSADGANDVTVTLEVVDAYNATGAQSTYVVNSETKEVTFVNNVVLLNDATFDSLEVSHGYTFFGNGFTITCAKDTAALDTGYAFVTLDNGTLDNVQIVLPNFDHAVLYKKNMTEDNRSETTDKTRYFNVKSGVKVSGNSQILNSRISGARAAVNVTAGNCVIDNSRLEGGAVATLLVGAANSITLRDVTLVQKPTASTYDPSKVLMGFSVLVICTSGGTSAPITLEGYFIQNAWASESDKQYVPSEGLGVVSKVLDKSEYLHDIDGDGTKESVNLGIAYMPADNEFEVKEPAITDNRNNKNEIPYEPVDITFGATTYVYSYKNTKGTDDDFKAESKYVPNKYSDVINVTYSDASDGLTSVKSFETNGWVYELNVDLDKLSGYKLDFSKLTMSVNGVVITDYKVNSGDKPSPVAVKAGGVTYTLTAIVDGKEYTATYKVTGVETAKSAPEFITTNWSTSVRVTSGRDYSIAADVLTGIVVKYWSVKEKKYVTLDLTTLRPSETKPNGTNSFWEYVDPDGDYTLKITNTAAINTSKGVWGMPVVYQNKLYFTVASTDGMVTTSSASRSLSMEYVFKDNNGGETKIDHTWTVAKDATPTISYSDMVPSDGPCVTPDTLITLADGSQVRVDSLKGDEMLLVWNMETGKFDYAPTMFVDSEAEAEFEVVKLYFSDGTEVKVIGEHGFWDYDLNKYVYLDRNAADYIGHTFAKQNGDSLEKVTLVDVVIETELTTAWSPVTVGHLCYFVNGMLSMPGGVGGLFNIFEVDPETMTYDYEQLEKDIETYGLFTYEELNAICPLTEEMFNAAGGAYLKISIGKGNLTIDELINMINRYSKFI